MLPAQSWGAFPGANGKIAFSSSADGDSEIYTINPDGTGLTQLTHNTISDSAGRWSPDGQKLLFTRADGTDRDIWVMNADGTGQSFLLDYAGIPPTQPSWSPDGSQIVFTVDDHCDEVVGGGGLFTANADGSNLEFAACGFDDGACCAAWSPDGRRIVWAEAPAGFADLFSLDLGTGNVDQISNPTGFQERLAPDWTPNAQKLAFTFIDDDAPPGCCQVRTMNPDGSGETPLREGSTPAWSPDGTKIAFTTSVGPGAVWTADADGTNGAFLADGSTPSWQPVPVNSYARPKGATPSRFSLVPAYSPCASPNRTHGPSLAFASCAPPVPSSPHLTVGTPDVNAMGANFIGFVRTDVIAGNPATPADEADVALHISTIDVHCAPADSPATCGAANYGSTVPDYTGELEGVAFVRITDKDNTPYPGGPGAGTVEDFDLRITVPCSETAADNMIGSTCVVATTVDALAPGAVQEGRRAIWALDRVHVRDGGPDGVAATADNRVFARAGVFVP